jgi:hypothetical protein
MTTLVDQMTRAVALVDGGLESVLNRNLVGTDEMTDMLLDIRRLLVTDESPLGAV